MRKSDPQLAEVHRGSLLHYILGLAKAAWLERGGGWMNQSKYDEEDHSFSNDVPIYYPDIPDTAGPHEV